MANRIVSITILILALVLVGCAVQPVNETEKSEDTDLVVEPIQSPEAQAAWREDLQLLAVELPNRHPDLFFGISQNEFEESISDLDDRIPVLTDEEIMVDFMKIVASVSSRGRDGHTAMLPSPLHIYPVQFFLFSDGLYVVDAQSQYQSLIGSRVVKIGDTDIEEVYQLIDPILPRDNEMTARWTMPTYLTFAEVLTGLGIVEDGLEAEFQLEGVQGRKFIASVTSLPIEEYMSWKPLGENTLPQMSTPLYLSNTQEKFWFSYLDDSKTLYIQYNEVRTPNTAGESIAQFSQEIKDFVTKKAVEKVVVDLRHNNGGDNTTYGPLLDVLSKNESINQPSRLFTIIGRQTFSAGMNFATDLERNTDTLFVGEPTGGSPNQYGDAAPLPLPNSGNLVFVSSKYWKKSETAHERQWIAPHIAVELSSVDYFNQHDPDMSAILARP